MRERSITLADTVSVLNGGLLNGDQATIVGTGAIWKDDSDGTYADIVTQMHGAGQPQFTSSALANVTDTTVIKPGSVILVSARVAAVSADMPYPDAVLYRDVNNRLDGRLAGTCPTSPTWVEYTMTNATASGAMGLFLADPSAFGLNINSPTKSGGNGDQHWRIYEARVIAVLPSTEAPPCRIFPRSDGLGVGSGRAFPPPKSHQRSPGRRGVGYY